MDAVQVNKLAALIRESYSPSALDPGVSEPTLVKSPDHARAFVLPRDQQPEPLRSMRLVDAAGVGATLVVTFTWADGTDDETVYLMPLDARDLNLDLSDEVTVSHFLLQHIEHTLGGPRESWATESQMISSHLSVVRPWTAR